jgi:hypothetical protein
MSNEDFYVEMIARVDSILTLVAPRLQPDADAEALLKEELVQRRRELEVRVKELHARDIRAEADILNAEIQLNQIRDRAVTGSL